MLKCEPVKPAEPSPLPRSAAKAEVQNVRTLVSVVVPVYNHARFVGQCLESVFAQSHRPLQLIVIDDGSRDGSNRVVEEFLARRDATPDVEIIFRARENRGAHNTINEGLEAARGAFVAILNSDDYYHPERLATCLAACESSATDLAITYLEPVGEQGEILPVSHPWRGWYNAACLSELAIAPTAGFVLLEHNLAVSSGNLFFRRALYERIGPFRDFMVAHDLDFLLRALQVSEPYVVKEKLYFYRIHGANTFQSQEARTEAELTRIYGDYIQAVAGRPPENPLAPCRWHWPASYQQCLRRPRLARALDSLLPPPVESGAARETRPVWRPDSKSAPGTGGDYTVITHELTLSGAPKVALEITAMLQAHGVRVNVISLFDGPLRSAFEEIGVNLTVLETRFAQRLAAWIQGKTAAALERGGRALVWRMLRKGSAHLATAADSLPLVLDLPVILNLLRVAPTVRRRVIANSFGAWPVVLPLSRLRSFDRLVWFVHESFDPNLVLPRIFFRDSLGRLAHQRQAFFLFGSDATRRIWSAVGVEGATRYWSGLPKGAYSPRSRTAGERRKSILSVGTSSGRKGTRVLIEAFAFAIRNGWLPEDVHLTIVGVEPPSRKTYAADILIRVQEPDLRDRVTLVPAVEAAALDRFYEEADVFVQSSNTECLPLSLLTAMAFGLPVVTTSVEGCSEAVVDGVCGRVVAPRGVAVLARAVADAVRETETSRAHGRAARERFEQLFSLEATEPIFRESLLG